MSFIYSDISTQQAITKIFFEIAAKSKSAISNFQIWKFWKTIKWGLFFMIFSEQYDFINIFSIWRRDQSSPSKILNSEFWGLFLMIFKAPYDNKNIFLWFVGGQWTRQKSKNKIMGNLASSTFTYSKEELAENLGNSFKFWRVRLFESIFFVTRQKKKINSLKN